MLVIGSGPTRPMAANLLKSFAVDVRIVDEARTVAEVDIGDAKSDKVAAPQLAIDRGVEHDQIANAACVI